MAKKTLTAANAIIMLSISGLYSVAQQLQGFAAEDVFDADAIDTAETSMGVDGRLSAGLVLNPIKQGFTLQGDSDSIDLFDNWYLAQLAVKDLYWASGSVTLKSIGRKYTMTNGVLQNYKPISDAKKILQPRKFSLVWESVTVTAS